MSTQKTNLENARDYALSLCERFKAELPDHFFFPFQDIGAPEIAERIEALIHVAEARINSLGPEYRLELEEQVENIRRELRRHKEAGTIPTEEESNEFVAAEYRNNEEHFLNITALLHVENLRQYAQLPEIKPYIKSKSEGPDDTFVEGYLAAGAIDGSGPKPGDKIN